MEEMEILKDNEYLKYILLIVCTFIIVSRCFSGCHEARYPHPIYDSIYYTGERYDYDR